MSPGIQHAFNSLGEKQIKTYFVDGYVEWELTDANGQTTQVVRVAYEYFGCRFHRCPHNCGTESRQSDEEYEKEQKRLAELKRICSIVKIKYGCQWKAQKREMREKGESFGTKVSTFLMRESVAESEILDAIREGRFYGVAKVDIQTPEEISKKYEHLNFPLIFNSPEITEDMLTPEQLQMVKSRKEEFPLRPKTLTWNARGYVGCTPLLKFYMELGMKVTNIQWALEYQSEKPFEGFVNKMVDERISASQNKNGPKGDRAKFVLNSAVGKYFSNSWKY